MQRCERFVRQITLALCAITVVSLLISAMGALVEAPVLAYFWFLALAGILSGLVLSMVLAALLLVIRFVGWYQRQLQLWNGRVDQSWRKDGVSNV